MARTPITAVVLLAMAVLASAAVAGGRPADPVIRVEHDPDAFTTEISIRATQGRVAWSDVARGLARARGYDDTVLEGVLPDGSFDISSTRGRVLRAGLNLALRPKVRFDVERVEDQSAEPLLVIKLDRAALLASRRRFKAWLRSAFLRIRPGGREEYGLRLDDDWNQAAADKNLVVFVHGLNSSPEQLEVLLAETRNQRFPCATFRYPNDQPIIDSAKLLARELAQLAKDHPQREVSLVTHSMGGLVARAVIEDPESDPGNVRQLIMVAPPNHGSALARFAFGLEFREHVPSDARGKKIDLFYALIEDGLSEAARDLRPGSSLLQALNARSRNPKVRYSIFLGSGAPLSDADLARLRKRITAAGGRNRWARFFGPRLHEWLEDLDEVVRGKGDGAVSIERGRLEGVEDTVVLRFGHVRVLDAPDHGDVNKVHQGVLNRLKAMPR